MQLFCSLPDGSGQRGLAFRADGIDPGLHFGWVESADRHEQLDVVAVPFSPVTVCHQAGAQIRGQVVDEVIHDLFRNLDLWFSADLPPHGTGGIQDKDDVGQGRFHWGGQARSSREEEQNKKDNHEVSCVFDFHSHPRFEVVSIQESRTHGRK